MVRCSRWLCSRSALTLDDADGKNLRHLLDYAYLRTYMRLFYNHSLLTEALKPGWPRHTAGRALGLWIGWLGGGEQSWPSLLKDSLMRFRADDLSTETPQESDERFFVLKPYVFAAHKVS